MITCPFCHRPPCRRSKFSVRIWTCVCGRLSFDSPEWTLSRTSVRTPGYLVTEYRLRPPRSGGPRLARWVSDCFVSLAGDSEASIRQFVVEEGLRMVLES